MFVYPVLATLSIHVSTGSDDRRLRRASVIVMKPAEDWTRYNLSANLWGQSRFGDRYFLQQTLMGPGVIEVAFDVLV